jgi:peptidoglycan/LPS O-acetylase OafA/YrhL
MIRVTGRSSSRLLELDLLRALAILLVLGRHLDLTGAKPENIFDFFLHRWEEGGWVGVDLFFVLSGFLVSGLLFREYIEHGDVKVGRFLIRRGFKIYPPFYFLMAATAYIFFLSKAGKQDSLLCELAFVQNYCGGIWNHTWSLAVEEHFYLLLAIYVSAINLRRGKTNHFTNTPIYISIILMLCLVLRILNAVDSQFTYLSHLYPTHLRIDSLAFGVLISYYYQFHRVRFMQFARSSFRFLLPLGVVALLPPFFIQLETHWFIYTFGLTLFYLGSGMLLVSMLVIKIPRNWLSYTLGFIGVQSYSIYLWHSSLQAWWLPLFENVTNYKLPLQYHTILYLGGSIVLGILFGLGVERSFIKLRDSRFSSRTKGEAI